MSGDRGRRTAVAAFALTAALCVPTTAFGASGQATPAISRSAEDPLPTAEEVARAAADAVEAARLAETIRAEQDRATARLLALQTEVTRAVRAVRLAEAEVRDAAAAVDAARWQVAAAAALLVAAERARADQAAVAYQQGGSLGLLPVIIDPRAMEALPDLAVVLEGEAQRREGVVDAERTARDAAVDAEREVRLAATDRERAAARAKLERAQAEASVEAANAEVQRVGARLAEAQDRLDELLATATGVGGSRAATLTADIRARAEAAGLGHLVDTEAMTFGSDPEVLKAQLDPKSVARELVADHGWGASEMACLDDLWQGESGWSWNATNASSGAYGIPQALPGWKMSTAGPDWLLNPRTQMAWGLDYIEQVYGSPCGAWSRWQSRSPHWY